MNAKERSIEDRKNVFLDMSADELKEFEQHWYPGGSGPIQAMYVIAALLRALAEVKVKSNEA